MTATLTDLLLKDYLECNSKAYLRLQEQTSEVSEFSALSSHLDALYRERAFNRLNRQNIGQRSDGSRVEDRLARGDSIILDVVGSSEGLETHFDCLERCSSHSWQGEYFYRPIRFCRHQHPASTLQLLLAFDSLVLRALQGDCSDDGFLICGSAFRRVRIRLQPYLDSLASILPRLRLQTLSDSGPPLILNRNCNFCEFKEHCRSKAVSSDNLSLLKGMTLKEIGRLNAKGIFTVNQLSYTFRLRKPSKRQKQRFEHSFALQARALRENTVHVHGHPRLLLPLVQVYLDIEGLPDRAFYYLIGVLIVTPQSIQHYSFWADDETHETGIFVQLANLVATHVGWKVFHFGNYEVRALRKMLPRLSGQHQAMLQAILSDSINVLSIVGNHIYFPTTSNSLKEIATHLGFKWAFSPASGLQSAVWRNHWEETQDDSLKANLLQYNRDDCSALRAVTEFVASIGDQPEVHQPEIAARKIIYTNELDSAVRRKHKFGKSEFCIADFEVMNRHAYFNYWHDKVQSGRSNRRNSSQTALARKRPHPRLNKRIEIRCKRCPHCGGRKVAERRALSTRTIDLKFFGGGVKKWVTLHTAAQYYCDKCQRSFKPPGYPQKNNLYGEGLANWVVYQNVVLDQNLLKIERCLRDVFKLHVPQCTVQRFKAAVARRFQSTNEEILSELIRGASLSVDETEARLSKEKAHVWVFAGTSGAYYECRDSRNGEFLIDRLKAFGGVLVSDFFTAYDGIDCPQQKCLIHLIRDMNEDMKGNPFDGDLNAIVRRFATVMRPIIETIDRYGLSKRHLQRHKTAAVEFVEGVMKQRLASEVTTKYKKRIEKYGSRMFTFLDYDHVPWHNNQAEHAIKAFARYRRFADGRFTKKSLGEYLSILSVVQTCEYRGVDVLGFLLSGQTSL
jgi:predicted RecB family nuclease